MADRQGPIWGTVTHGAIQASGRRRLPPAAAWTAEDTYMAQIYALETPFRLTFTCRFVEDGVVVDASVNVAFGPTQWPQLVGQVE